MSTVRRRHADSAVRFIHVEIYKDNDPAKGVNQWVTQWKLPSEPWVFVVGTDGKVRDRFEGTVSVRELDASVASTSCERGAWAAKRGPLGHPR